MFSERLDIAKVGDVPCEANCSREGDYKMIETLSVNNFRCFEHIELFDLKRVNIIVGRNASGKTALLEAIFFVGAAQPETGLRLRGWRLLGDLSTTNFQAAWKDLFFGFDDEQVISISIKGTPQCTQSLRVFYEANRQLVIPLGQNSEDLEQPFPLTFERTDCNGQVSSVPMMLTSKGLRITTTASPVRVAYYASTLRASTKEAADRFSTLSKRNQERRVLATLQRVYPFIEGLSLETNGNEYMVYATVTGVPEKVPVSLISEGIYKLMSILLGIADTPGGVILIDEIENGFYYETLPEIWQLLLEFCEEYRVQLFVSTHSLEALKTLQPMLEEHAAKFSLLRTEKKDEGCIVRQFPGLNFRHAIEQRIEVR